MNEVQQTINQLKSIPIDMRVNDNYIKIIYKHLDRAIRLIERLEFSKWVDEGQYCNYSSQHIYKCDACSRKLIAYPYELSSYSYCPSCGSLMEVDT